MDARHFDSLTRALTVASTRRNLLGLLATLPILGGLFALFADQDGTDAKGRRKRHKKPHHHRKRSGNRAGKKKKRRCKPNSFAKTCAGRCGPVKNNCKKSVDCGSCACDPACEVCFTCQEGPNTPGACVVDSAQQGQTCGSSGQLCQPAGACECDATSCGNPTPLCVGTVCQACASETECQDAGHGDLCCGGSCFSGICCTEDTCSSDGAPDCVNHDCVCAAESNAPCDSGETCCDDGCADLQTDPDNCAACGEACPGDQVCQGGVCGFACGSAFCPAATEICDEGACQTCTVCADDGLCVATVQAAIDAANSNDTIYICAGTYPRSGTNRVAEISGKDLTLAGAGKGVGGAILDGNNVSTGQWVVSVFESTSVLRNLTVRGANGSAGILNAADTMLTLSGVSVTGNNTGGNGGGIFNNATLILNAGTSITLNKASSGGGINNNSAGSHLTLNSGASVTHNEATGTSAGGILNAGTVVANAGSEISNNIPQNCVDVGSASGCPA